MDKKDGSRRLTDKIMSTMAAQCLPGTDTKINQEIAEKLKTYSAMTPTSLSISELLEHGRRKCKKESFQFLRMCLPIRLANMIMELQFLPPELTRQPQFQEILHEYFDSFKKMLEFEMAENNKETHAKFMEYLIYIRKQHANTVPTMAAAMKGMIMSSGTSSTETFQYFLDRLYLNRISIHLLISNYRELHGDSERQKSSMVGVIDPDCDLIQVAKCAYEDATFMCDREYMDHPNLHIQGFEVDDATREVTQLKEVSMAYIPSHLHHIFFEIFKNGMRATCEKNLNRVGGEGALEEIKCIIYKSKNDITIRISDVGGGINRHTVDHVFDYQYTTAKHVAKISNLTSSVVGLQSPDHPMHGLGYGLPLSRLYARYFQGDLKIASVDGYGTDVYIYLQALSDEATEHLPNFSQAAVCKLRPQINKEADWIDKLSIKSPWRRTGH
jgi:pyruvate dehydrogenase kinase 2/3/4